MRRRIEIKRGMNLQLQGAITDLKPVLAIPDHVGLIPADYAGFTPKVVVHEGDAVRLGDPLLRDKTYPDICIVSPATGVVSEIKRGERRVLERIVVKVDDNTEFHVQPPVINNAEQLKAELMHSGMWAMMRRRPFGIMPKPDDKPRDIIITCFDTSPLAPDFEELVGDVLYYVGEGVKALRMLTTGTIYLCVDEHSTIPDIPGAEVIEFNRLHPAGNPGFQLAQIRPINKGEIVWTMDLYLLAKIGELVSKGSVNPYVNVAITGSEVKHPCIIRTLVGASIETLLKGNLKDDDRHKRIISGNVLSGAKVPMDGYLRYPYRQITVIPEGDDVTEFMGWAQPGADKLSNSRSILGHFFKKKKFSPDARLNGGRRAMIMSEQWDKVFPMDIMPEYLIKAILAKDIDQMEALGIYEVSPEDFALAEYLDPSKIELQRIVREGLQYLRKETD